MRIHCELELATWNTYALAVTIEICRLSGHSAALPEWMAPAHHTAMDRLARAGLLELPSASTREHAVSILSVLALWKGLGVQARALTLTDDELAELLDEP